MKLTLIHSNEQIICEETTSEKIKFKIKSSDIQVCMYEKYFTCVGGGIVWLGKKPQLHVANDNDINKLKTAFGKYMKKKAKSNSRWTITIPESDIEYETN